MRSRNLLHRFAPVILLIFAFSVLATPANADPSDDGGQETPTRDYTVRYVQADSEEEAERIFERMENGDPMARARVKYGPCELEVQGIYLRQSYDYNSVGFKSSTKCDRNVTSIHRYMRPRIKEGLYWNEVVPTTGTSNVSRGVAALSSKGTSFLCLSKDREHW